MTWNRIYWDIIDQIFWTPRFIGLKSEIINDKRHYVRCMKFHEVEAYLHTQEEILNHIFDLTFSIASDEIINALIHSNFTIKPEVNIENLGREIAQRYGWRPSENVTQTDGQYLGENSLIFTELKLNSPTSVEQIVKYACLAYWEEKHQNRKLDLGLLYIVPHNKLEMLNSKFPRDDRGILLKNLLEMGPLRLSKRIKNVLDENPVGILDILNRLEIRSTSWWDFVKNSEILIDDFQKQTHRQTETKLLLGLNAQIKAHQLTQA